MLETLEKRQGALYIVLYTQTRFCGNASVLFSQAFSSSSITQFVLFQQNSLNWICKFVQYTDFADLKDHRKSLQIERNAGTKFVWGRGCQTHT